MWNRPQLMSAISDLLFLAGAAALLVAGAVWAARLPLFPLQEVVITQELSELRRDELEYTLAGHLKGNFFSVNLDALRASLEQLPWVRRADARDSFPCCGAVDRAMRGASCRVPRATPSPRCGLPASSSRPVSGIAAG